MFLGYYNFSKDGWESPWYLADDKNIFIKRADQGLGVVVWDYNVYIAEEKKKCNWPAYLHKYGSQVENPARSCWNK